MRHRGAVGLTLLAMLFLWGCSPIVPKSWVPGKYVASYPFGTEVLTLERNGQFAQRIELHGHTPVVVHGEWALADLGTHSLRVKTVGALEVTDAFGELRANWDKVPRISTVYHSVELVWFRIELDDAAPYPYVKQ